MANKDLDGVTSLDIIKEKLDVLHKESDKIDKKIIGLVTIRDKIIGLMSEKIIKTIPKNLEKIKRDQWKWILECNGNDSDKVRYKYRNEMLEKVGLSAMGYYPTVSQPNFYISQYNFNAIKLKKGFAIVKNYIHYINPTIMNDEAKKPGIRIVVRGLKGDDESTSSAYLYTYKNGFTELFTSFNYFAFRYFNLFVDWYNKQPKD